LKKSILVSKRARSSSRPKLAWSFWLENPWRIICLQLITAVATTVLLWLFTWNNVWTLSYGYGSLCVLVPALAFANGVFRKAYLAESALLRFYFWEVVKLVMTVFMLVMAPRIVRELNWWALLAGLVVTMKVYAVAAWANAWRTHRQRDNGLVDIKCPQNKL
jgi:ATP synthase protein I